MKKSTPANAQAIKRFARKRYIAKPAMSSQPSKLLEHYQALCARPQERNKLNERS